MNHENGVMQSARGVVEYMPPPIDDSAIEAQLQALQQRKIKLTRLVQLRQEVSALEKAALSGTDAKWALNIICGVVCERFQTDFATLLQIDRRTDVCLWRHLIFYLTRQLTGSAWREMGEVFQQNHGTAMFGYEKIQNLITTDPAMAALVAELTRDCKRLLDDAQKLAKAPATTNGHEGTRMGEGNRG